MTVASYEERDIYIVWTFNKDAKPAMIGIFEDMDEAKACCEFQGDCVQPTKLNRFFGREHYGVEQYGKVWVHGRDDKSKLDKECDKSDEGVAEDPGDTRKDS